VLVGLFGCSCWWVCSAVRAGRSVRLFVLVGLFGCSCWWICLAVRAGGSVWLFNQHVNKQQLKVITQNGRAISLLPSAVVN